MEKWERILRDIQGYRDEILAVCPNSICTATGEQRLCWDVVEVGLEREDGEGDAYSPLVIARGNTLLDAVEAAAQMLGHCDSQGE